ncbi:MAG: tetratricopeptide repeat protein, partial [Candidatus Omnitrophica bacterium]|nr:tetratricopeptide repeat protein [Candidatus Omnitrophota bacterium]
LELVIVNDSGRRITFSFIEGDVLKDPMPHFCNKQVVYLVKPWDKVERLTNYFTILSNMQENDYLYISSDMSPENDYQAVSLPFTFFGPSLLGLEEVERSNGFGTDFIGIAIGEIVFKKISTAYFESIKTISRADCTFSIINDPMFLSLPLFNELFYQITEQDVDNLKLFINGLTKEQKEAMLGLFERAAYITHLNNLPRVYWHVRLSKFLGLKESALSLIIQWLMNLKFMRQLRDTCSLGFEPPIEKQADLTDEISDAIVPDFSLETGFAPFQNCVFILRNLAEAKIKNSSDISSKTLMSFRKLIKFCSVEEIEAILGLAGTKPLFTDFRAICHSALVVAQNKSGVRFTDNPLENPSGLGPNVRFYKTPKMRLEPTDKIPYETRLKEAANFVTKKECLKSVEQCNLAIQDYPAKLAAYRLLLRAHAIDPKPCLKWYFDNTLERAKGNLSPQDLVILAKDASMLQLALSQAKNPNNKLWPRKDGLTDAERVSGFRKGSVRYAAVFILAVIIASAYFSLLVTGNIAVAFGISGAVFISGIILCSDLVDIIKKNLALRRLNKIETEKKQERQLKKIARDSENAAKKEKEKQGQEQSAKKQREKIPAKIAALEEQLVGLEKDLLRFNAIQQFTEELSQLIPPELKQIKKVKHLVESFQKRCLIKINARLTQAKSKKDMAISIEAENKRIGFIINFCRAEILQVNSKKFNNPQVFISKVDQWVSSELLVYPEKEDVSDFLRWINEFKTKGIKEILTRLALEEFKLKFYKLNFHTKHYGKLKKQIEILLEPVKDVPEAQALVKVSMNRINEGINNRRILDNSSYRLARALSNNFLTAKNQLDGLEFRLLAEKKKIDESIKKLTEESIQAMKAIESKLGLYTDPEKYKNDLEQAVSAEVRFIPELMQSLEKRIERGVVDIKTRMQNIARSKKPGKIVAVINPALQPKSAEAPKKNKEKISSELAEQVNAKIKDIKELLPAALTLDDFRGLLKELEDSTAAAVDYSPLKDFIQELKVKMAMSVIGDIVKLADSGNKKAAYELWLKNKPELMPQLIALHEEAGQEAIRAVTAKIASLGVYTHRNRGHTPDLSRCDPPLNDKNAEAELKGIVNTYREEIIALVKTDKYENMRKSSLEALKANKGYTNLEEKLENSIVKTGPPEESKLAQAIKTFQTKYNTIVRALNLAPNIIVIVTNNPVIEDFIHESAALTGKSDAESEEITVVLKNELNKALKKPVFRSHRRKPGIAIIEVLIILAIAVYFWPQICVLFETLHHWLALSNVEGLVSIGASGALPIPITVASAAFISHVFMPASSPMPSMHLDLGPLVMMNKPKGYISAAKRDPNKPALPVIAELLPSNYGGLKPMGQLDKDTTGVILFGIGGELFNILLNHTAHPENAVLKTYEAVITGNLSEEESKKLINGVVIEALHREKKTTKPHLAKANSVKIMNCHMKPAEDGQPRSLVEITISEGVFHQVKKMFEAVGHSVLSLRRTAFGKIKLGGLKEGEVRELTPKEYDWVSSVYYNSTSRLKGIADLATIAFLALGVISVLQSPYRIFLLVVMGVSLFILLQSLYAFGHILWKEKLSLIKPQVTWCRFIFGIAGCFIEYLYNKIRLAIGQPRIVIVKSQDHLEKIHGYPFTPLDSNIYLFPGEARGSFLGDEKIWMGMILDAHGGGYKGEHYLAGGWKTSECITYLKQKYGIARILVCSCNSEKAKIEDVPGVEIRYFDELVSCSVDRQARRDSPTVSTKSKITRLVSSQDRQKVKLAIFVTRKILADDRSKTGFKSVCQMHTLLLLHMLSLMGIPAERIYFKGYHAVKLVNSGYVADAFPSTSGLHRYCFCKNHLKQRAGLIIGPNKQAYKRYYGLFAVKPVIPGEIKAKFAVNLQRIIDSYSSEIKIIYDLSKGSGSGKGQEYKGIGEIATIALTSIPLIAALHLPSGALAQVWECLKILAPPAAIIGLLIVIAVMIFKYFRFIPRKEKNPPGLIQILAELHYPQEKIPQIAAEFERFLSEPKIKNINKDLSKRLITIDLVQCLLKILILEARIKFSKNEPGSLVGMLIASLYEKDIFEIIKNADITQEKKDKLTADLLTCPAYSQFAYICLRALGFSVKRATNTTHVFTVLPVSRRKIIITDFTNCIVGMVDLEREYKKEDRLWHLREPSEIKTSRWQNKELGIEYNDRKRFFNSFHYTEGAYFTPVIVHRIADILLELGKIEEAIKLDRQALDLDGDYANAWLGLGKAQLKLDYIKGAKKTFSKFLQLNNHSANAYCSVGLNFLSTRYLSEARDYLSAAVQIDPQDNVAHESFNIVLLKIGDRHIRDRQLHKAIDVSLELSSFNPKDADIHCSIALNFFVAGYLNEAIEYYNKAIICDPKHMKAYEHLACVYLMKNSFAKALSIAKEAIKQNPEYAPVYVAMGIGYYNLNNYIDSIKTFIRAIELAPESPESHFYLGEVYEKINLIALAIEEWATVVQLDQKYLNKISYRYQSDVLRKIEAFAKLKGSINVSLCLLGTYKIAMVFIRWSVWIFTAGHVKLSYETLEKVNLLNRLIQIFFAPLWECLSIYRKEFLLRHPHLVGPKLKKLRKHWLSIIRWIPVGTLFFGTPILSLFAVCFGYQLPSPSLIIWTTCLCGPFMHMWYNFWYPEAVLTIAQIPQDNGGGAGKKENGFGEVCTMLGVACLGPVIGATILPSIVSVACSGGLNLRYNVDNFGALAQVLTAGNIHALPMIIGIILFVAVYLLPVYFFTVANIQNNNVPLSVIDGIDNTVVSDSDAVELGRTQLLAAKRTGILFQGKQFFCRTILNLKRKLLKLPFCACSYADFITHLCLGFCKDFRKERKGFIFSQLRFAAMAKSIISSLRRVSLIIAIRNEFCSLAGKARKAVMNTSAVACGAVIWFLLSLQNIYHNFLGKSRIKVSIGLSLDNVSCGGAGGGGEKSSSPAPESSDSVTGRGIIGNEDYFYSKSTGYYVGRTPLKVDARVIQAADRAGIKLNWDDEGSIVFISREEGMRLLGELNAVGLTCAEYWKVYKDAGDSRDREMLRSLESEQFTEWLDVHFYQANGKYYMIEHPRLPIEKNESNLIYKGKSIEVKIPKGRPGWFNPEDAKFSVVGIPQNIRQVFEGKNTPWKYWDIYTDFLKTGLGAIRGYVTSSGTPSLDLGIPPNAKQPVLMLRECRRDLPTPNLANNIIQEAGGFIAKYEGLISKKISFEEFWMVHPELLGFLRGKSFQAASSLFKSSQEKELYKLRERIIDMLGMLRLLAETKNEQEILKEIKDISQRIFQIKEAKIDLNRFVLFVKNSRDRLNLALSAKSPVVFVMGHKNPDTDTVISALAESFRNYLINGQLIAYFPVVQADTVPKEIRRLLGDELSDSILLTNEDIYKKSLSSGQARWILVDQNAAGEVQKFILSIIDHHAVCKVASRQNISKTLELVGSTTALVAQKIYGLGVEMDKEFCRILYGATLMDTENRLSSKMTSKDKLIMDILQIASGRGNDKEFYRGLMDQLLSAENAKFLFKRDYKEDWGFGFSVAKLKGIFDNEGRVLKASLIKELFELAKQNNKSKNLPLTIIKIVDYKPDNETVNRERIYLIFGNAAAKEFIEAIFNLISEILNYTYRNYQGYRQKISREESFIEFWGVGVQISRKKTAPLIEPVVAAFNEYFYSPSTGLYVKREFLTFDQHLQTQADSYGLKLCHDNEGRINHITYYDARFLLKIMNFTAMSLREYWLVRKDAEEMNDAQMIGHLQHKGFVEFLDTLIEKNNFTLEHPEVIRLAGGKYSYEGQRKKIEVLDGHPGLIHPREINLGTGLPLKVCDPDKYSDVELWRYWSPDAGLVIPTRGHIFLLGQPALDMKIHPYDALPHLGIRPCCGQVSYPEVKIQQDNEGICVEIKKTGKTVIVKAGDFSENDDRTPLELIGKNFSKGLLARKDVALICLKGGNIGGLHPKIKNKIIRQLSQWFEFIEGEKHKTSFKETVDRWGTGYLYFHFRKKIEENANLDKGFINTLVRCMETKNEEQFNLWLQEAKQLAKKTPELLMPLLVYEYYANESQQLLLKLRPGIILNMRGAPLQRFVKRNIVGATFCYDAKPSELRFVIKEALQKEEGLFRSNMKEATRIFGKIDYETERFISSIFNGIHCADAGAELEQEVATLTDKDMAIFVTTLGSNSYSIGMSGGQVLYSFPAGAVYKLIEGIRQLIKIACRKWKQRWNKDNREKKIAVETKPKRDAAGDDQYEEIISLTEAVVLSEDVLLSDSMEDSSLLDGSYLDLEFEDDDIGFDLPKPDRRPDGGQERKGLGEVCTMLGLICFVLAIGATILPSIASAANRYLATAQPAGPSVQEIIASSLLVQIGISILIVGVLIALVLII